MADEQPSLSELIEAVADGTLDLTGLVDKVPEGPLRELMAELRVLAGVADVHRSQVAGETAPIDAPGPPALPAAGATSERWGNFELLRKVGEGSFGEVYLARDLWLDHQVALKVVKPHVLDSSLILKEARKLVRIRHPNVVTVHGADIQSGRVGFWMDFVDGPTLADVIRRDGVRSVDEAAAWAKDLCRALAVVHAAGIVHRDIKAQNVMRQRGDGRLILMDFGAGQFMDPRLGADASTAGTPLYLAPELLEGARGTERSDVYALGVLLFYILSGRFPVEGSSWDELVAAHARGERRRLEDVRPDLPDAFAGLVRRMIAPDAADRFETVGAVRQALDGLQTPVPVHAPSAAPTWTNAAVAAAGGIALVTFSGYLCSNLYNSPLGRTGGFENESPLLWPVWGMRQLIASGIVMGGLVLAFVVVRTLGRIAIGTLRPRRAAAPRAADRRSSNPYVFEPSTVLWVVLGQAVVIGVSAWMFRDILAGLDSFISQRAPVDFSPLAPENQPRQVLFSLAVCSQVLAFTAAWLRLGRAQWRSATNETRALILGGAFLTAFTFAGGETGPFRILYHNRNERVTYASQRCYLVGTKEGDGRLFCPEHAPWTRAVRLDDPALERQGVLENIFTGLSSAKSPE